MLIPLSLIACGSNEIIVPEPVVVPIPGTVERTPVPPDFLVQRRKSTIPDTLTYGDSLQLWAEDRASLDSVNAQLGAIEELTE